MNAYVHVVYAPVLGPIAIYSSSELAHTHARSITGGDVKTLAVSRELIACVLDDLGRDFDDEDTPVQETT